LTPGPNIDGGYHTPSSPGPVLGTLVSFAQTTDSDGSGTCPPPPGLNGGSTATIGFWQNKNNGQAIIKGLGVTDTGETVGQWLVQTFPHLFSGSTVPLPAGFTSSDQGTSDAAVAAYYLNVFANGGNPKTLAQAFDLALTTYATDESLNGGPNNDLALVQSKGFQVSSLGMGVPGTGGKTFFVDTTTATALGLMVPNGMNGNNFTVFQILVALDQYAAKNGLSSITTFNDLLDSINSGFDI
jgi:hypothetical protein